MQQSTPGPIADQEHWTRKRDVNRFLWQSPPDIIATPNGEIGRGRSAPGFLRLPASSGGHRSPTTPEEFGACLKSEYEKQGRVVHDSGALVN